MDACRTPINEAHQIVTTGFFSFPFWISYFAEYLLSSKVDIDRKRQPGESADGGVRGREGVEARKQSQITNFRIPFVTEAFLRSFPYGVCVRVF